MKRLLLVAAIAGTAAVAAPASASTGCEQQDQRIEDLCYATVGRVARYLCDEHDVCIR